MPPGTTRGAQRSRHCVNNVSGGRVARIASPANQNLLCTRFEVEDSNLRILDESSGGNYCEEDSLAAWQNLRKLMVELTFFACGLGQNLGLAAAGADTEQA